MPQSPIERIVVSRVAHQLVVQRLVERVYDRRIISNVERGAYVECLIELALSELRPPWSLTDTWASWDLEQSDSGARIEIKQSAALQTWAAPSAKSSPTFDIAARSGYYTEGDNEWIETKTPQRHADLYVMARHDEDDPRVADQRLPDQWAFYVVPEHRLPEQKSISLNPLRRLAEPCGFDELAEAVARAVAGLPSLKADQRSRSVS